MKVYYATSTAFHEKYKDTLFKKTVNYLGFKVGQKNLKVNKYNPPISTEIDPKEAKKIIKYNEKALKDADVVVTDITESSGGVGFQIALALLERKPVLAVRYTEDEKLISNSQLTSSTYKNIEYEEYANEDELTKHIDEFIGDAETKIDTKFILIIPAEIDKYLNWAADFRRMHKAQIVRQAIEKEMDKDKDWKDYLERGDL
jgi:nucleoside 2-deoxyribosyltransferase